MSEYIKLTTEQKLEIEEIYRHFPRKEAACVEGLKLIQKFHCWVSDEAIKELSEMLDMSPAAVDSLATYYSLIFRRPVGRHVIYLCNSVSCWIMGYEAILKEINRTLGVAYGETTGDGRFTLLSIPCLGNCDHAPAMLVGEDLHEDLRPGELDGIFKNFA